MPDISVLIKPASSACNMKCDYCFYLDEAANRKLAFTGFLDTDTAELIIRRATEFSNTNISFMFQGGEPTLAGIDFYKNFIELEKKYQKGKIRFHNAIQTNGFAITAEWAEFFVTNNFLVGLSLDGPADIHNKHRKDRNGNDSFNNVLKAAALFDKHKVEYNILCVVNGQNVANTEKIYNFFKKKNFGYIQFIPCLDPIEQDRGCSVFSLTPEKYSEFLIKIFRLWFNDLKQGRYVSIRHIDNYLRLAKGLPAECCSMNGHCSIQFVIEGNGNVYPCDFYVLDDYCIGNIKDHSFKDIAECEKAKDFILSSCTLPEECKKCRFRSICRNGCKRDRLSDDSNYYCKSYKDFFTVCEKEIVAAANYLIR